MSLCCSQTPKTGFLTRPKYRTYNAKLDDVANLSQLGILPLWFMVSVLSVGRKAQREQLYLQQNLDYGKSSEISNTLLFLFSNEMLVIRAVINKMFVRIANIEDPDQTASSLAV